MKQFIKISLSIIFVACFFSGCQKESTEPSTKTTKWTPAQLKAKALEIIKSYESEKKSSNSNAQFRSSASSSTHGAMFLDPTKHWFGYGFFNFAEDGSMGVIYTDKVGAGDFVRKNPDGTTTVNINIKDAAFGYYYDASTGKEYSGEGFSLKMQYSGTLNECGCGYYTVDPPYTNRILNWSGKGNLQQLDPYWVPFGPWHTLEMLGIQTPSGQTSFKLNFN